jgi:hypothetical protein
MKSTIFYTVKKLGGKKRHKRKNSKSKKHFKSKMRKRSKTATRKHTKTSSRKRSKTATRKHLKTASKKQLTQNKKSTQRRLNQFTSLTISNDKSPQILKKDEVSKLNRYTTKNVSLIDKNGKRWNGVINNRLIYKRPPRNQDLQINTEIIYGPRVEMVTNKNYKNLKKGDHVFYDRNSIVFRGPFVFQSHKRGPELLFKIKDVIYPREYLFSIGVKELEKQKLYRIISNK